MTTSQKPTSPRTAVGTPTAQARRRALLGGCIGHFSEWYDFAIYAYLATVLSTLFFPSDNPTAALMATFAAYGVGYVMRPIGAVVFGHFGDRLGRRQILSISIVLMAVSTFLVGVLPTYESIGVAAPILLCVLRLIQGLSAGGEFAGGVAFLVEYAGASRRGFYGSFAMASNASGFLVGALIGLLITGVLPEDAVTEYAWRIPFLVALPIGLAGLYIRLRLAETPEFEKVQSEDVIAGSPVIETIRKHKKSVLRVIGLAISWNLIYVFSWQYLATYMVTTTDMSLTAALGATCIGLAVFVPLCPVMGALSDRYGRRPVYFVGVLGFLILIYPLILLFSSGDFALAVVGFLVVAVFLSMISGVAPATLSELFPTKVRYSAVSIGYNLSATVFGGTFPLVAVALTAQFGGGALAIYIMLGASITLLTLSRLRETAHSPLSTA